MHRENLGCKARRSNSTGKALNVNNGSLLKVSGKIKTSQEFDGKWVDSSFQLYQALSQ